MGQDDRDRSRARLQQVREETLAVLEMRHSGNRLAAADYDQKVAAAQRATTTHELQALLVDNGSSGAIAPAPKTAAMPATAPVPRTVSMPAAAPVPPTVSMPAGAAAAPRSSSRSSGRDLALADEQGFVIALLSGAQRKGNWEPPARLYVGALMGGAELDFREADLLEGVTEVSVGALLGGVNIVVPPDLDVEVEGLGLLGSFAHASRHTGDPGAPLLRIRGLALLGGVSVKVKK
jgi:hypothetical protein